MKTLSLSVIVAEEGSVYKVLSPAVGYYHIQVKNEMPLAPGSEIGILRILNKRYNLKLPGNISGKVLLKNDLDFSIPVGFKEELFRLDCSSYGSTVSKKESDKQKEEVNAGDGFIIKAFTTGIFYRKPSPDSPPFIEVGKKVEKGKTLGLIEVMKSFNQIIFSGEENFNYGIVKKIYAEDSQEVKTGEPLFLISKHGGS
jgi:acetyl-CoA carboxylase biotin carboxyl carrier protein